MVCILVYGYFMVSQERNGWCFEISKKENSNTTPWSCSGNANLKT
jgi:hypothetical protein